MEENLNKVWMGSFKLRVNRAKFNRNKASRGNVGLERAGRSLDKEVQVEERRHVRQGSSSHAKSYAEVVSGKYRSGRRNEVSVAIKNNETISVDLSPQPQQGTLNRLESSLVGELKNFDSLRLIGSLKAMEGWAEIRFCYLGGLSLQLDFPSKSNAQDF